MEKKISGDRLQSFFLNMTRQSFWQLGINDATVAQYVADVLTDFASTDSLYRIRSRAGKKSGSVVEILAEKQPETNEESRLLRERALRKYLGDYTLFMRRRLSSFVEGKGFLDSYLQEGRRSYWTVSELDLSVFRPHPPKGGSLFCGPVKGLAFPFPPPVFSFFGAPGKKRKRGCGKAKGPA